ncbi:MAG: SufD family Fe-S cluster assembly protein [bacterium]|nr:SufD family Fe-S cluster assembly protein [bacterium]
MNNIDNELLKTISGTFSYTGAYNIRKNGESIDRQTTPNIDIVSKKDKSGLDIYIKDNTTNESLDIPVLISNAGIKDVVYNDFFIGDNVDITIVAGCGIHSELEEDSEHDGIHRFYIGKNSCVKYIEKHYAEGFGLGKKIISPVTEIYMKDGSSMEMETSQIRGIDDAIRTTKAKLDNDTKLVINEKIMTHENQKAKTVFEVVLNGKNSSSKVTSRSVAIDKSKQYFISKVTGNNECFGHVECDAIVKDNARVTSTPKIVANNINASLVHEATIGKIAKEQLVKLMTLGLSKERAEETIINGFLN